VLRLTPRIAAISLLLGPRPTSSSVAACSGVSAAYRALLAGASGYLEGDAEPAETLRAVRDVAAGRPHLSGPSWAAALGLPAIRFHDLRHTAATLLLERGVHPKIVQERLGHSNVGMTLNRYSHLTLDMQREAADRLDAALGGV
jgi:integrase-like protein